MSQSHTVSTAVLETKRKLFFTPSPVVVSNSHEKKLRTFSVDALTYKENTDDILMSFRTFVPQQTKKIFYQNIVLVNN